MAKFLFRVGLAVVAWLLLTRERQPQVADGQTHPYRLPGRTVFVGELELFVREAGPADAPPILLVHGWGDAGLMTFRKIIPLLAEHRRVIVPDLRNVGKSDVTRGPIEVSELADDIAGLIDELGVGSVPIVGYSLGGMVAQELARRHPASVSHLVLAGTTAAPLDGDGPSLRATPVAIALTRAAERITKVPHSDRRTRWLVEQGAVAPEHHRWAYNEHVGRDPSIYWELGGAAARFDASAWVGELDVDALVIINTMDNLVPVDGQYRLVSLLGDCDVAEVAATHAGPLTHADRYADAIEAFLA